ncbi:MAG: PqqD family protein [Staphylothermus sp.]|nr:PqqD family protein [Staphylothermus sp.]
MSEEKDQKIKVNELFQEIKILKPTRQGVFLGEEEEKFYVAKSEEEVYELSALAYYVWLLCDGEHTVEEMVSKMSQDVKVSEEEVIEPLVIALDSLSHAGLVKFV